METATQSTETKSTQTKTVRILRPGPGASSKEKLKLLLVDNSAYFLDQEKSFLSHKGFTIFTALTGADALKILYKRKPDLVILELFLPEVDGFEVLKWVRAQKKLENTKVIVLSSSRNAGDIQKCRDLGCDEYLSKPITGPVFFDSVIRVLEIKPRSEIRVPCSFDVKGEWEKKNFTGKAKNLSAGGIYVETNRDFPLKSPFSLSFSLPGRVDFIFTVGKIVRVEKILPMRGTPTFGLAFQFVSLGAQERERIKWFISTQIKHHTSSPPVLEP